MGWDDDRWAWPHEGWFRDDGDCGCGFRERRLRRMRRGDTLAFTLTVLMNPTTGEYGAMWPGEQQPFNTTPVNLTGWRVIFTAKYETPDWDNQSVAQLDNQTLGGVTAAGTGGVVVVSMPPTATVGFADTTTTLVYDLQGIDASGNVHTFETGRLRVLADVTRVI
jgi:hypothetical protein